MNTPEPTPETVAAWDGIEPDKWFKEVQGTEPNQPAPHKCTCGEASTGWTAIKCCNLCGNVHRDETIPWYSGPAEPTTVGQISDEQLKRATPQCWSASHARDDGTFDEDKYAAGYNACVEQPAPTPEWRPLEPGEKLRIGDVLHKVLANEWRTTRPKPEPAQDEPAAPQQPTVEELRSEVERAEEALRNSPCTQNRRALSEANDRWRKAIMHTNTEPAAPCPTCEGTGDVYNTDIYPTEETMPCPTCKGAGKKPAAPQQTAREWLHENLLCSHDDCGDSCLVLEEDKALELADRADAAEAELAKARERIGELEANLEAYQSEANYHNRKDPEQASRSGLHFTHNNLPKNDQ
jgi:hypothetical protein